MSDIATPLTRAAKTATGRSHLAKSPLSLVLDTPLDERWASRSFSARAADRLSRYAIFELLGHINGRLIVHDDVDGRFVFGTEAPDRYGRDPLRASIRVHHPGSYRRVVQDASVGIGDSYANGWWDTDDLPSFLRLLSRNVRRTDPAFRAAHRLAAPVTDPIRRLRRQDRQRDRDDIHIHYDLGNEFFELLLDETMMYSSAVFPSPDATLADGSRNKLDLLCQRMALRPTDHLFEIGTGWGGMAVHAAQNYGCRVTTTTISDRQYEYARKRVHDAGLDGQVTVLDQDYRDVVGRFDAIVSVEMIEAVDWREYDTFFRSCHRLLAPDGRLGMQAILIPGQRFEQNKARKDFIKEIIFPGGCLPSLEALLAASARVSDLSLTSLDDYGSHYVETLRRWRANLDSHRHLLGDIGLDERFARLWEFYLAYCEAGFDERDISVVQLVMTRPGWTPDHPGRLRATA